MHIHTHIQVVPLSPPRSAGTASSPNLHQALFVFIYIYIYICIYPSIHLSIYLSIYISICIYVYHPGCTCVITPKFNHCY